MATITVEEWRATIEQLTREQPCGFSARELSEAAGISIKTVREKLRVLIDAKLVVYVGPRTTRGINGRTTHTPVYRLIES